MKLLVVEDERRMLELLRQGLTEEGHAVVCAADGWEGLRRFREGDFDVVVLDVMMPKLNGYELARLLREENSRTPLLMLTAKDAVPDVVEGLDCGADDYVTKPFSFRELLLRLHAVRRSAEQWRSTAQVGDLLLDRSAHTVSRAKKSIALSRTEYLLLERLLRDRGKVVSRQQLIECVWGSETSVPDNSLDAFIRLLRNKVDCNPSQRLIHTVRGTGYVIRTECDA